MAEQRDVDLSILTLFARSATEPGGEERARRVSFSRPPTVERETKMTKFSRSLTRLIQAALVAAWATAIPFAAIPSSAAVQPSRQAGRARHRERRLSERRSARQCGLRRESRRRLLPQAWVSGRGRLRPRHRSDEIKSLGILRRLVRLEIRGDLLCWSRHFRGRGELSRSDRYRPQKPDRPRFERHQRLAAAQADEARRPRQHRHPRRLP